MNILNIKTLFFVIIFVLLPFFVYPHGNNRHNETGISKTAEVNISNPVVYKGQKPESFLDQIFVELPTLHPIVIHIPIIMLLIAFPIYLAGIFLNKNDFRWLAVIISAAGFLGGIAAAYIIHPHTEGLSQSAAALLKYHERLADATIVISFLATLAGVISITKLKNRMFEYVVLGLMLLSIAAVSITGHFGGSLVYLHGVGPQGKYLGE